MLLLLASFGVLYATTLDSYGMFMWDEAEYASLGRSVMRGEGFTISGTPNSLRPPVLPLAAAASMLLCNSTADIVAKLPSIACSVLALFVVYWCVAREVDRTAGLIAAAVLGLSPTFWTSTAHLLTEIPFMAFFSGAVLCFYSGLYRDARYFHWSWLCCALALLTRYTAMLFMPIAASFVVAAAVFGDRDTRARIFSGGFVLSPLVGLAVVLPWFIRQQLTFGDALIGVKRSATQLQVYVPDVSMPWHFYLSTLPETLSWALTAAVLVGIASVVWKRCRFGWHCVLVGAGILVWFSCYRYKEVRLATSALPFMAIAAAIGVRQLLPAQPAAKSYALLALGLGSVGAVNFAATRTVFRQTVTLGYPSFRNAMQFIREHTASDAVLVGANHPQIAWYADRRTVDFPDEAEFKGVLERSDWVIVTNFERGQKPYARALAKQTGIADPKDGSVVLFNDRQFATLLIRSDWLRKRF